MLLDTGVFCPLTVTPSPDRMALKLQQMAAKTVQNPGESLLLQKAREQTDSGKTRKPEGGDIAKVSRMLILYS